MENSFALNQLPKNPDQPKKRKAIVHEEDLPTADPSCNVVAKALGKQAASKPAACVLDST